MVPFWAVTNTVIVLMELTPRLMAALGLPEATVVPFTFTVEVVSVTVGVTVTDVVALDALEV